MLKQEDIQGLIPPQENAIYWLDDQNNLLDLGRNVILEEIEKKGRKAWKEQSGYHRRIGSRSFTDLRYIPVEWTHSKRKPP